MSDAAADTATPVATDRAPPAAPDRADPRLVGWWLVVMAGLVWLMVVVGGATRLTESGLSMVDWQPIRGVVPPLTEAQWLEEFEAYRQYPEYKLINRGMSLAAFKTIFWWEYAHRLLGRLIGLAFALPLAVFWLRGIIPPGYKPRLVGLLLLGGAQGLLGWFMVKSGLVDEPEVSHYRLTAHLTLAFAIFAALMWTALSLLRPRAGPSDPLLRRLAGVFVGLVFLQVILGGLVAGLKAGYAFNSWPLMDGRLIPRPSVRHEPVVAQSGGLHHHHPVQPSPGRLRADDPGGAAARARLAAVRPGSRADCCCGRIGDGCASDGAGYPDADQRGSRGPGHVAPGRRDIGAGRRAVPGARPARREASPCRPTSSPCT